MNRSSAPPSLRNAIRLVTRWDLDKTYLYTEFDTMRDLVRTAMEKPEQKRDVPGAARLLKELAKEDVRVHIVSGSPRQLRSRLARKLTLDGVRFDQLTLKPNLSNLLRLRLRALHDQLGYKLPELLAARLTDQQLAPAAQEVLVGDDAEADALVYSLYADLCAGHVDAEQLSRVLSAMRVYNDRRRECLKVLPKLVTKNVVSRILIHLDRQSPPSRFWVYGRRVVPFYNYLQAAFVLTEDKFLNAESVLAIAREFMDKHHFDTDSLAKSYLDLMRRGHVDGSIVPLLERALGSEHGDLGELVERIRAFLRTPPKPPPIEPRPLDYVSLAYEFRSRRKRRQQ
ncbi:MAG TPA: phosphatase domain-containing protein [Polyangiaceae bacterium]|nr:phosphatase domain-containing protein [Polyangiaceae bacterium]